MYEVFCGSEKAMQMILKNGARIDEIMKADEEYEKKYGEKYIKLATLLCNKDLRKIAEKKGLIL